VVRAWPSHLLPVDIAHDALIRVLLAPALHHLSSRVTLSALHPGTPLNTMRVPAEFYQGPYLSGRDHPALHAVSMIVCSIVLIVTGFWLMPAHRNPRGERTRPRKLRKVVGLQKAVRASRQRPACTGSFRSGILLPRGSRSWSGGEGDAAVHATRGLHTVK
jgi:hypothetical protein